MLGYAAQYCHDPRPISFHLLSNSRNPHLVCSASVILTIVSNKAGGLSREKMRNLSGILPGHNARQGREAG